MTRRAPPADPATPPPPAAGGPSIWLLLGDKLGDNAQVEIVAEALGRPVTVKRLVFTPDLVLGKPRFGADLHHLDAARSDPLAPPWPDVILTIGRRPSMAALWVKERSGGRARIVLVGRPKRWIERFDLVVAPAQFRLPDRPNVLKLDLPLMRADEAAVVREAEAWRGRLASLPRPLTALLVGGQTKPFRFDRSVAAGLAREAARLAADGGGSLCVVTSRRTQAPILEGLRAGLPPGVPVYAFDATGAADGNPYRALLGLADRFVVTGDSASMMVEVARLGKPLAVFPLPYRPGPVPRAKAFLARHLAGGRAGRGVAGRLGEALNASGMLGFARDLTALHRKLYAAGLAVPLGRPFPPPGRRPPDDLPRVVERVEALLRAPSAPLPPAAKES